MMEFSTFVNGLNKLNRFFRVFFGSQFSSIRTKSFGILFFGTFGILFYYCYQKLNFIEKNFSFLKSPKYISSKEPPSPLVPNKSSPSTKSKISTTSTISLSSSPELPSSSTLLITIDCIPSEILREIFVYLDLKTLINCSRTCKSWNKICNEKTLWKNYILRCGITEQEIEQDLKKIRLVQRSNSFNSAKEYFKVMQLLYIEEIFFCDSIRIVCKCSDLLFGGEKRFTLKLQECDSGSVESFQSAFNSLSKLSKCQNLVKHYGYFVETSLHSLQTALILTEYCDGGTLQSIINSVGSLDELQISSICSQLVRALIFLHARNISALNIKPSNILLTSNGIVKLCDYGNVYSKLLQISIGYGVMRKNEKNERVYFMAPELVELNEVEGWTNYADIWSLGILALTLAEGKPPKSDIPPLRAIFLIVSENPPTLKDPSQWSESFQDFLSCCLQRKPSQRSSGFDLQKHSFTKKGFNNESILAYLSQVKKKTFNEETAIDPEDLLQWNLESRIVKINRHSNKWTSRKIQSTKLQQTFEEYQ